MSKSSAELRSAILEVLDSRRFGLVAGEIAILIDHYGTDLDAELAALEHEGRIASVTTPSLADPGAALTRYFLAAS